MGTNTSLTGLVLLSTIGTTSFAIDYQNFDSIAPLEKVQYNFDDTKTWHYNQVSNPFEYNNQNTEDVKKLQVVVDFAKEIISDSEDLDSEFSRIVNENFMDLLWLQMTFDEIKIFLPKFLSAESENALFEGLKDFPNNLDSRLYTLALKHSENIFQGDGIKDMLIINLPDENVIKAKSMILSNSCDVSPSNKRNFESNIVYAPIFNLNKYYQLLLKKSTKNKNQINSHIETIRKQKNTQIFFLPKIDSVIEDSIVFLDRINSCSLSFMNSKDISQERLFTLSDYGSYLFVYKLSIHFSRIKDKVDRNKGVLK